MILRLTEFYGSDIKPIYLIIIQANFKYSKDMKEDYIYVHIYI